MIFRKAIMMRHATAQFGNMLLAYHKYMHLKVGELGSPLSKIRSSVNKL